jgi:hypothetical protein
VHLDGFITKKNQYTEWPKKMFTHYTLILMSKECINFLGPFCIRQQGVPPGTRRAERQPISNPPHPLVWIDCFHYLNHNNPPQGRPPEPDKSIPSPFILCVMIYFNIILPLSFPIHLFSSAIIILSHVLYGLPVLIICDIICLIIFGIHLPENIHVQFLNLKLLSSYLLFTDLTF